MRLPPTLRQHHHRKLGGTNLMHDPHYRDATATLYAAAPRDVLTEMPDKAVDCIVTSPPAWTPPQPGQSHYAHGHEPTPGQYLTSLRRLLVEAHRVLADEGTCWLITSDRYATDTGWDGPATGRHARRIRDHRLSGLPIASLIGLPWQIAFAACDDGWIIRNAIIWHHPTEPDDDPATDRLHSHYELIFLLVKNKRYHLDLNPIRQPQRRLDLPGDPPATGSHQPAAGCIDASARHRPGNQDGGNRPTAAGNCRDHGTAIPPTGHRHDAAHPSGKNPGDVWTLPAPPSGHGMPIEVPLRCIAAGCRPGGTVLDPFTATATTGLAARALGRSFIGIEADESLCDLATARLSHGVGEAGEEPR